MTDIFEITMDKMVFGGDCMGRLPDGRAVFVPFVLPGELVRIEIVDEKKRYARGWLVEIIQPSPDRIPPRCMHFGDCGGCQYQNLTYTKQLTLKESILRDQLVRIGKIENPPIQPIVPSPNPWNYRNTVQFHLGPKSELGYIHADGEHLMPVHECHLPEEPINTLWPQIDLGEDCDINRLGIRYDSYGSLMLVLEGEGAEAPEFSVDLPISAVYTPPDANLTVLAGDDHLTYTLFDRDFQVSSRSFFQVNIPIAEKMVTHLGENLRLEKDSRVIELYAGAGLFSAFVAPHVGHLTAVESSGSACHDFTINLDDFDNVVLYEAEAEAVMPSLNMNMDVLIADPPRSGLAPDVHDAIGKMLPEQIAYISCDPATLARDVRKIIHKGYRLVSVTPFDQFPHTAHIETVVIMSRIQE